MKIIGITGKSGSGKSFLASELAKKLNCSHIDIDKIGHQATNNPNTVIKLCDFFGTEILNEDKTVNRKKLGNIVFADKSKMDILTELTWDYMQEQLDAILLKLENANTDFVILEWILLPQSKYWNACFRKFLVTANHNSRKETVLKRDNISEEYFEIRDSASIDYSNYNFNYIFDNDYNYSTLIESIKKICSEYLSNDSST